MYMKIYDEIAADNIIRVHRMYAPKLSMIM